MEYEYSDKHRHRSKLYIAAGLIIAALVAAGVYVVLQSGVGQQQVVEMRDVVVAVREIPSRKPIEEGDVTMRSIAADPTNETAFAEIGDVVGRVTGVSVGTGQLLTQNMLASTTEGQTFSILEPGQEFDPEGPDFRAISVSVPDDRAVAGVLQPGQRVDLVATVTISPVGAPAAEETQPGDPVSGPSTKVTMQSMTILARSGALYILRTDLATAEKVAEMAAAGGTFTLVLRPDQDERTAETDGSTLDMLVEEFGFPTPLIAELENR